LGASAKLLRFWLISSYLSVRLPAQNYTTPIGRIYGKFQIWYWYQNLSTHTHLGSNRTKIKFYMKIFLHMCGGFNGDSVLWQVRSDAEKTGKRNNLKVTETVFSVRYDLRPKNSKRTKHNEAWPNVNVLQKYAENLHTDSTKATCQKCYALLTFPKLLKFCISSSLRDCIWTNHTLFWPNVTYTALDGGIKKQ
jgi:RNase P subunit RPR2